MNGLEQINLDEVEFANAKLIQKPSGFYIHLTVYSKKQPEVQEEKRNSWFRYGNQRPTYIL